MPPKKSTTAAKPASSKAPGPTYEDMIKDAILNLKERKGSSRQQLKKYVKANNKTADGAKFDTLFNTALSKGVTKGLFAQPKGASGPVKLATKAKPATDEKKPAADKPATKSATKPAAKKATTTKKAGAPKKAATEKKPAAKKAAAPKKATTAKKPAAKKATTAKKPAAKKAAPKKPAPAPAVEDKPVVLGKTKTGRITKTTGKSTTTAKKVTKVPAKSKATPKKATPKKA